MLLLALIGVELVALMAILPETLETWWRADRIGDFVTFFHAAEELQTARLYSPALSVMLWPLTVLGITNAYRVYLALGGLAMLAVAFLAQRSVRGTEARIAVALGVLSVPQMHWALRLGHVTPLLALTTLSGFLLLRRTRISRASASRCWYSSPSTRPSRRSISYGRVTAVHWPR